MNKIGNDDPSSEKRVYSFGCLSPEPRRAKRCLGSPTAPAQLQRNRVFSPNKSRRNVTSCAAYAIASHCQTISAWNRLFKKSSACGYSLVKVRHFWLRKPSFHSQKCRTLTNE